MAVALHSPHPTAADAFRRADASVTTQVLGVVGFALLAALGAQVKIYLWEVPITLQTVAVYGAGLFLGGRNGLLAMGLYLASGLFFPVFAGDGHGIAYFSSTVSAGYILSYPFVALLVGALSARWNSFVGSALSVMAGSVLLFTVGVAWLHVAADHATWTESIVKGWLLFAMWDLAKVWFVAGGYVWLRRQTAE